MKPWLIKPRATCCRLCSSADLYPGRGVCRKCYLLKLKQYRAECGTDSDYYREWRGKNREALREYNRAYAQKRRKAKT
jgi:hypothetical protein